MRLRTIAPLLALLGCVSPVAAEEMQPLPEVPEEQMNSQVLAQCAGFYVALAVIGGKSLSEDERKAIMEPYLFLALAAAHARTTETGAAGKLDMDAVAPEIKSASSAYMARLRKRGSTTDPVLIRDAKLCKELAQRVAIPNSTKPPP